MLAARHAHADIADVLNGGQLAASDGGTGGVVLASQRVEAVARRRRADAGAATVGEGIVGAVDDGGLLAVDFIGAAGHPRAWAPDPELMMAQFRSEMGNDRSGMKMNMLMTGEEDLPRVATVINVGLQPRRIWNVLVVAVVMNGLDRGDDGSAVVGFDGGGCWLVRRRRLRLSATAAWWRLRAAAAGGTTVWWWLTGG
ncbi:hypothetical protein ACLOJK_034828 [Asimina triloba]